MDRFTFTMMNHEIDRVLNSIVSKAMDSGIKSVSSRNNYYITIEFNDGSVLDAWNSNKYYAWLSSGVFIYPKKDNGSYKWKDSRLSKSTMSRLCKMLSKVSYDL